MYFGPRLVSSGPPLISPINAAHTREDEFVTMSPYQRNECIRLKKQIGQFYDDNENISNLFGIHLTFVQYDSFD